MLSLLLPGLPYLSAVFLCLRMQFFMVSVVLIDETLECHQHKQANKVDISVSCY